MRFTFAGPLLGCEGSDVAVGAFVLHGFKGLRVSGHRLHNSVLSVVRDICGFERVTRSMALGLSGLRVVQLKIRGLWGLRVQGMDNEVS